jgi:hypothetical protein
MSTLKTDAITAVTADADLSLDGLGTGGVSVASTLKMTKGGDIASASPLVIDVDGNYFDVTGTTNFAAMTVESGNFFMLQFDGALTITHGSGIELPGAANLTTAAGDRLICYATAANTVEVMSVELETAASAGFTLGTEQATTSGSSINFTSIPSGTTVIYVHIDGVSAGSEVDLTVQLRDSGGLETSGYNGVNAEGRAGAWEQAQAEASSFIIANAVPAAQEVYGLVTLALGDSSNNVWFCSSVLGDDNGTVRAHYQGGRKALSATLDGLSLVSSGTFDAGSVNISYI